MLKKVLIFGFGLAFVIAGCGKVEEAKQAMQTIENVNNLAKAGDKAEQMQKIAQERKQARRAKGDTLAMHFTKLKEYLPASVSGYTMEEPNGQTTNMMGFSLSEVNAKFKKDPDHVDIKIIDYNEGYDFLNAAAYWMLADLSVENSDGFEKTWNTGIEYVWGFEKYSKNSKQASLTMVIGWRFMIEITANNQSGTDLVKSIANSMKLKELSQL